MAKIQKSVITHRWLNIKAMYENGTNGSDKYGTNFPIGGELDILAYNFVNDLGALTVRNGYDYVIEDVKLDLWKERIWCLIENAGLLKDIIWKEEKNKALEEESNDSYYDVDDFEDGEYEPSDEDLMNVELI
tara:strand:- start:944 stop:1339 length:396 start_codon:yes stop_codon:yes gene_type:complete